MEIMILPGPGRRAQDREENGKPRVQWRDILAMLIAGYRLILPTFLLLVAALVAVLFLFRLLF